MAAADASFKTSIDAISEGCTLFMSTPGIPSTTINGPLLADSDVPPLSRKDAPLAGSPEPCITVSPATLPCKSCSDELMTPFFISSAPTDAIAPVRSEFLIVPYPIPTTTASSRAIALSCSTICRVSPVGTTLLLLYPTNEMVRVLPLLYCISNFPSISVITPFVVPDSITVAPGSGLPVWSVTVPLAFILFVSCALAGDCVNHITMKNVKVHTSRIISLFFFIIVGFSVVDLY